MKFKAGAEFQEKAGKGKKMRKWKKNKMGKIRPQATNLAV